MNVCWFFLAMQVLRQELGAVAASAAQRSRRFDVARKSERVTNIFQRG